MTNLLPCPFCGRTDLIIRPDKATDDDNHIYAYHVFCNDCHARGRNNYQISWCETEDQAADAWNRRYVPAMIMGDEDNRVQLSTDALFHIHGELGRINNMTNRIQDLLTPIQMYEKKSD